MLTVNKSSKKIGIVDCNNFFVSCERLFNPALKKKPVVVLSNNDGCVISRSQEAKKLGIPMGAPAYKYQYLFTKNGVVCLSSNYELYGDMSRRVTSILQRYLPQVEVYSVDESFIDLTGFKHTDYDGLCRDIRSKILTQTGIPVSIGIGPTKTLAKLANHQVKHHKYLRRLGRWDCESLDEMSKLDWFKCLPIKEVWGIGRRIETRLNDMGITTVYQLIAQDSKFLRNIFSVELERTILELKGISCFPLNAKPEVRKSIAATRSFGHYLQDKLDIAEAVATYVSRAATKLRQFEMICGQIEVFIRTNPYSTVGKQYRNSTKQKMYPHTDHTPTLTKTALEILDQIYLPGYNYAKAGVIFTELMKTSDEQLPILTDPQKYDQQLNRKSKLHQSIDNINARWGKNTVKLASEGINASWSPKSNKRSQAYSSNWQELYEI